MNLNQRIREALTEICDVIVPQVYTGDAQEYIVFNYFTLPTTFGDNEPEHEVYYIQLHYFAPLGKNILEMKKQIKRAIKEAGFTYPSTTDASDNEARHVVFEFRTIEGAD